MAFWNSGTLRERLPKESVITPYQESRIKSAAYELSLGAEAFRTSAESAVKMPLGPGAQFRIPPGQLALLITEEVLRVPLDALGFISIRAGIKFRGLVNVSGFHVDPGFHGRIKFTVYNAGSHDIVVTRGDPIFLLWFSSLDQPTPDPHNGVHKGQLDISADDVMRLSGDTASPAALKAELDELKREYEKKLDEFTREYEKSLDAVKLDYDKRISSLENVLTLLRRLLQSLIVAAFLAAIVSLWSALKERVATESTSQHFSPAPSVLHDAGPGPSNFPGNSPDAGP